MNTETENSGKKLQGAFGDRGTNVNAIAYGHPHADKIIEGICEILRESKSGRLLLVLLDKNQVNVQIMKGTGESGFSPDMNTIFLQIPGKISQASGEHFILFTKALHEAAQEFSGFKTPDPMKDVMAYASFIHGRNLDSISEVCQILKELTNSSHFSVLLDSMQKLGLNDVYKEYVNGASRDKLYEKYAEAYDRQIEGVV